MPRTLVLVPALVLARFLLYAPPVRAARYTLAELVGQVTREHPAAVAARATLAVRRAQLLEQELRYLPDGEARLIVSSAPEVRCIDQPLDERDPAGSSRVNPDVTARLNNCIRTDVVDLVRSAPGTTLADREPLSHALLNFTMGLRQPLMTSGKIESAVAAGRAGVGTEEANVRASELDLAVTAVGTFAQLKAARAALAAIDTVAESIRGWLDRVERDLDSARPRFVEADAARLRVQLENVRISRLAWLRAERAAAGALAALTGDPRADVDDSELEWQEGPIPDASYFRERMRENRPEVRYAVFGLLHLRQLTRVEGGWALPDVGVVSGFQWGYSPSFDLPALGFANLPASAPGASLGLALRQPLDLGQRLMAWRRATHDERMQRLRFRFGLGYYTLEVDKAWLDFVEAHGRLGRATQAERVTRGWYAAVDESLAIGAQSDGRELVEVLQTWMLFRVQRLQALRDSMVALATLRRLSGEPILGKEGSVP
jgi:outer membrane protein TolC